MPGTVALENCTEAFLRSLGCVFQILALGLALIEGAIYQGYLFQWDIYGWQERAQVATLAY